MQSLFVDSSVDNVLSRLQSITSWDHRHSYTTPDKLTCARHTKHC